MRAADVLAETRYALTSNKARSGLTILGIVVGIAAVIVMVAIGQGTQSSIEGSIAAAGSNLVMVMPGFGRAGPVAGARGSARSLSSEDEAAIRTSVPNVAAVAGEISQRAQVVAGANNTNTQILGTEPAYAQVRTVQMAEGSFLSQQEVNSYARVAVLGSTARDDLFGTGASAVGQRVRVKGISFRVIGVAASKGGSGFGNADDVIYAPLTTVQQLLAGETYLSSIDVQAASAEAVPAVQQSITDLLTQRHGIASADQADFNVLSQEQMMQTVSTLTGTFTVLLASIAGISLLVGGIGIMNMMLTTVTERTREIGLRKAVGARRSDVSAQFLAEAVALTFVGGVVGVLVGTGVSWGVTTFTGTVTKVSLGSVVLAFCVSAAIGLVFGYYPARRAASLSPMEALRYQ